MKYIGERIPRVDAYSKVCGEAIFGADVGGEKTFFIKVLRSPHAHAKLNKIDVSEALHLNGVLAVLTAKDIPGENLSGKIVAKLSCDSSSVGTHVFETRTGNSTSTEPTARLERVYSRAEQSFHTGEAAQAWVQEQVDYLTKCLEAWNSVSVPKDQEFNIIIEGEE